MFDNSFFDWLYLLSDFLFFIIETRHIFNLIRIQYNFFFIQLTYCFFECINLFSTAFTLRIYQISKANFGWRYVWYLRTSYSFSFLQLFPLLHFFSLNLDGLWIGLKTGRTVEETLFLFLIVRKLLFNFGLLRGACMSLHGTGFGNWFPSRNPRHIRFFPIWFYYYLIIT